MKKNLVGDNPAEREERGPQGNFADTANDKAERDTHSHEGRSQGGNGLSQKRDRMAETSRKGGK